MLKNKTVGVIFAVIVLVAAIGGYQALNRYITVGFFAPQAAEGCLDSDGGIVYDRPGEVSLESDDTQTAADFCSPDLGPGGLQEYYCDKGQINRERYFCPSGCTNGACINLPTQVLTVLSPNGGERWPAGSPQKIRWSDSKQKSSYAVYVTDISGSAYGLLGVVSDAHELIWVVGELSPEPKLDPGSYYIQVIRQDGSELEDRSDTSFTITK